MRYYSLLAGVAISFIILFAPAHALEYASAPMITFLGVEVELGETSHTTVTATFDQNSTAKSFKLPLFYDIQNLKAEANFGNISCSQQKKPFGSQIECAISPTWEKRMMKLEFDSFNLAKKIDNQFLYKQEFYVPFETKQLSFKVMLPEGMFLTSESVFQQYVPASGEKGSDGRRIFISWRKENLSAGDSFATQISYESASGDAQMTALFAGGILGLGIIVIAFVLGFWLLYNRMKKDMKIILPVLRGDEKTIMEILLKSKGASNQKILVRESNYSKAKVSKILKSLQERGVIRLERAGRSNNVYLVRDFRKNSGKQESAKPDEAEPNASKGINIEGYPR